MDKQNGSVQLQTEFGNEEHFLFTYSDEEKQQNEINANNAQLVLSPEFIPFYPAVKRQYGLNTTETLIYGFIKFFLSNNERFYIGNGQLSELFECSEKHIRVSIKKLKDVGLIKAKYKIKSGGGKIRFIELLSQTNLCFSSKQTSTSLPNKPLLPHIYNKIIKNKQINNSSKIDENNKKTINGKTKKPLYPDDFLSFWKEYPRRIAKKKAYSIWKRLSREDKKMAMAALPAHIRQWKDPQFIPHPATWLNQRRWEDELPKIHKPQEQRLPTEEEINAKLDEYLKNN